MFEQPLTATMPAPETKIDHIIAKVPALEMKLDEPSVEQIHANDEVFRQTPSDADNIAGVIGMVGGLVLLHDVAVDTIQDVSDLEGHMQREKRKDEEEDEE
jgi:hypothetical protein